MRRYAITNRAAGVGDEVEGAPLERGIARLLEDVRRWARGGVEYIQLREKGLPETDLTRLTELVLRARDCGGTEAAGAGSENAGEAHGRTLILVNTYLEAALAAGADGVHLTASSAQPSPHGMELSGMVREIRQRYRAAGYPEPTVSLSCHTVQDVRAAAAAEVDLLLFGPVFGKVVRGERIAPGLGLRSLRTACDAAGDLPLFALGGVTWQNAGQCMAAGATGVAGIRLFES